MHSDTGLLYMRWRKQELWDEALSRELIAIEGNEEEINDRFYRSLEFGTAGLRGKLGAGTNRMNVHSVAHATEGYARYLKSINGSASVAIAYDNRINSELFARTAASVFAANGVLVQLFPRLMPTPALSFAVRMLKCEGGVVITASHNPQAYNGYKVYGADGCQCGPEAAAAILKEINGIDIFSGVKRMDFSEGLSGGIIKYIGEDVVEAYLAAVSGRAINGIGEKKELPIIYTPLNGTGLSCVRRVLLDNGFTNIFVVPEQAEPDGRFPTCPFPNPELKEALELGLKYMLERKAELLVATDPDCDRMGAAVRAGEDICLITGNQMGVLMLDYIAKSRIAKGTMPAAPVMVKTIVTTDMADKVAKKYGVTVIDVLTGFKYIGGEITALEKQGEEERFIFGYEESYGFMTGAHVRDKDGVNAALIVCEMANYYKEQGKNLMDVLDELYQEHGYFADTVDNFYFEGEQGFSTMQSIMDELRAHPIREVLGKRLVTLNDYLAGTSLSFADGSIQKLTLPASNVLKYRFEDDITLTVRPSGTEPKLKAYYSVCSDSKKLAESKAAMLANIVKKRIYSAR